MKHSFFVLMISLGFSVLGQAQEQNEIRFLQELRYLSKSVKIGVSDDCPLIGYAELFQRANQRSVEAGANRLRISKAEKVFLEKIIELTEKKIPKEDESFPICQAGLILMQASAASDAINSPDSVAESLTNSELLFIAALRVGTDEFAPVDKKAGDFRPAADSFILQYANKIVGSLPKTNKATNSWFKPGKFE